MSSDVKLSQYTIYMPRGRKKIVRRRRRIQRGRGLTDLVIKGITHIPTLVNASNAAVGAANGYIGSKHHLGESVGSGKSVLEFLYAKKHGLI